MTWSIRGKNIVLQLNMGDGKSSVVVPIVAATHANGLYLSRVLTLKPQSRQMHQMLVGKLGGLVDRRVYQLLFSRSLDLGEAEVNEIQRMCLECMSNRGVLLVQPEYILSLKLMCLECFVAGKTLVDLPDFVEVIRQAEGGFPRIRVLDCEAENRLIQRIATYICENGIGPLPVSRQPRLVREAVLVYILKPEPIADEISAVESKGVLAFCLGQKRWRVNYGSDPRRDLPTRLAVPYRAKDRPSLRSEFSHPDVIILLTCLHYYYSGLTNDDLSLAFDHLAKSDEVEAEYQAWARDAPMLAADFGQLISVNLDDQHLCENRIFLALRVSKAAVDYFLGHVVFPKEMKEFADKLFAFGWDTGELRTNLIVGFSGTNDLRKTLSLTVDQLDLLEQNYTSALILEYLLRRENLVVDIPFRRGANHSDAQVLLDLVT
ncbi:unnamed protein product [Penicillium salamii]|uniref:ubiquitinyl hydrolase 1 n=1 Tax=Penicillium salamii TaxID=1612424 RepID=A0A9W4I7R6_9EURO|nr:unnamed protein product [Penicillium salamii]